MSKSLTVNVPHQLGREEAVRRLKKGLERLKGKNRRRLSSIEDSWSGDRMTFKAKALLQTVSGDVEVADNNVRIDVELPFLLRGLSERVRGQIEAKATKMLRTKEVSAEGGGGKAGGGKGRKAKKAAKAEAE